MSLHFFTKRAFFFSSPYLKLLRVLASLLVLLYFASLAVDLAHIKYFSWDEFEHAHAAWLIRHGWIPYKDFFELHLPLLYQVLSPLWLLLGDQPQNILYLRYAMLFFLFLGLIPLMRLATHRSLSYAPFGAITALSTLYYVTFSIEIRPDSLAFILYLCSLAILYSTLLSSFKRAFISGLLLTLSVWGSQKVFYYGTPFVAAFFVDSYTLIKRKDHFILGHPIAFLLGSFSFLMVIFLYLLTTESFEGIWRWCFSYIFESQNDAVGFSWQRGMVSMIRYHWWLFLLAGYGVFASIRTMKEAKDRSLLSPELITLFSLPSTFLSYSLQRVPYEYSLIPFSGMLAIFAARGLTEIFFQWEDRPQSDHRHYLFMALSLCVFLAFILKVIANQVKLEGAKTNHYQLNILAQIDQLVAPDDACYDNTGNFVSRPHSYFFFFTDSLMRRTKVNMLSREIPMALRKSETVMVFNGGRYPAMPHSVKSFINHHYKIYNDEIRFLGQTFQGEKTAILDILKEDNYFIEPISALQQGELWIDGKRILSDRFHLPKGQHQIILKNWRYPYHILWLPRNHKRWTPRPNQKGKFAF